MYTTQILADWVASVLLAMLESKKIAVVDPACGDGALLHALQAIGCTNLTGIDCDARAIVEARQRLPNTQLKVADGLIFLSDAARAGGVLEGVVANPPWGATLALSRVELVSLGYHAFSGQVDSWDFFLDGVLRALRPDAPAVLILPDALFLPEHRAIRGLVARNARIELIARLGEGFFPGVYRGTVVVALRRARPKAASLVACARLTPEDRGDVLSGRRSLSAAIESSIHYVAQSRFIENPDYRFDIDSREHDGARLATIEARQSKLDTWFEVGRGIELSKSGRIVRCPSCSTAKPLPRIDKTVCGKCGHVWSPDRGSAESIVRFNDGLSDPGWHALIVGEDVDRHKSSASRLIKLDVEGIRYKPLTTFAQPKLLVRKTGVGIKANVDRSGAATNQVVFHFTCRRGTPSILLDYVAGVLCSRVMLAWHLKRQGELEWRSHPYITPQLLRRFPIPAVQSATDWEQATAIASAVQARRLVRDHDSAEDLLIERLVAGMFGLSLDDMGWVMNVLGNAQQLEPIRTLRLPLSQPLSPIRVA